MKTFLKFPDPFWFGAALSGPQSEGWCGKCHENIMDTWYRIGRDDFYEGVGPDVTSDFFHHMEEDLARMKEMGIRSFRTSIQWSRLIEDLETGRPSASGLQFYRNLIDVVDLFAKFAKTAFENFGQDVKWWTTFNEPMVMVDGGYLYGYHYPKRKRAGREAMQVLYHICLASAKAIGQYRTMKLDGKIGIIVNVTPAYPGSEDEKDREAARFFDALHWQSFLDAAVYGVFPEKLTGCLERDGVLWKTNKEDEKTLKDNLIDFAGINYYHPTRVQHRWEELEEDGWLPEKYYAHYEWPQRRINASKGWEIYPKGIYDIAMVLKKRYPALEWFVSETGMGVHDEERFRNEEGMIQDRYRIGFLKEHLYWVHKAIDEGSLCFGFHVWAAFDCWSWNNAYRNRYGLVEVDINDQKRRIKASGLWYKDVAGQKGFAWDPADAGHV